MADDLVVTPPLFGTRPAMDLTCGRWLGEGNCGKPATWHVIWTQDTENSLNCDEHMDEALARWVFYDRHPVTSVCTMPESRLLWSWEEAPGRCFWYVEDEALAASANAEATEPARG